MSLSCECDFDGDYEYWYAPPKDYSVAHGSRRKRCVSCKELIQIGTPWLVFTRWRSPNSDIEERIYGDEVELAPTHMCEECGDLYLSLVELGFCITLGDHMKSLVTEYNAEYRK